MDTSDLGLFVLRVVVGLTFAAHGAQKAFGWWKGSGPAGWNAVMVRMGFRPAPLWGAISIAAELVGGLFFAAGFLTPLAAMALVGQSVVIILKAHWPRGFWNRDNGLEFPLSLAAAVVAILGTGAGALSIDSALGLEFSTTLRAIALALGIVGGLLAIAVARVLPATAPAESPR
jgi:putative oxidoreductase